MLIRGAARWPHHRHTLHTRFQCATRARCRWCLSSIQRSAYIMTPGGCRSRQACCWPAQVGRPLPLAPSPARGGGSAGTTAGARSHAPWRLTSCRITRPRRDGSDSSPRRPFPTASR